jgi:hypothetical protein
MVGVILNYLFPRTLSIWRGVPVRAAKQIAIRTTWPPPALSVSARRQDKPAMKVQPSPTRPSSLTALSGLEGGTMPCGKLVMIYGLMRPYSCCLRMYASFLALWDELGCRRQVGSRCLEAWERV